MNFLFKPTLQHIAVVKIVTCMWMESNITDIEGIFSDLSATQKRGWIRAEKRMMRKIRYMRFPYPELLRTKLLGAIKPIGDEIHLWLTYLRTLVTHFDITAFKRNFRNFCWKSQGTLDLMKTAEIFIRDEALEVFQKYELACMYCLENEISNLYDQLPETDKAYLDDEYVMSDDNSKLVVHWTWRLKEASSRKRRRSEFSQYKYAFRHAVQEGNKPATEYFFEKISREEKDEYIVPETIECLIRSCSNADSICHCVEYFAEISCFLLSQMNEEQQMEVFESCPYGVLKSLLVWLRQSYFLETASRLLSYIDPKDFSKLLFLDILSKIDKDYTDCDYYRLYAKLWRHTPGRIKRYVMCETDWYQILFANINVEGQEWMLMKWILKDATAEEKSNLIISVRGIFLCANMITEDNWEFVELFMLECISTADILTRLKDVIRDFMVLMNLYSEVEEKLGVIYSLVESKLVT